MIHYDLLCTKKSQIPKPFPGKYPTRIRLLQRNLYGSPAFVYTGKPSPGAFRRYLSQLQKRHWDIDNLEYREFDQNGWIIMSDAGRRDTCSFYLQYFTLPNTIFRAADAMMRFTLLANREVKRFPKRNLYIVPALFQTVHGETYKKEIAQLARDVAPDPYVPDWNLVEDVLRTIYGQPRPLELPR